MITEDYCSYEVSELLKEKGFDEKVSTHYLVHPSGFSEFFDKKDEFTEPEDVWLKCPTHQMAMKWLREEKHYYIQIMLDGWALGNHSGYYVVIQKTDSDFEMMLSDALDEVFYKTPEEACEASLKYCLENLI